MRPQNSQQQIIALIKLCKQLNPQVADRLLQQWQSIIESQLGHEYDLSLIQYLKKCVVICRNRRDHAN